jgi:ABC-type transport system involved in multi-copper enzyme maturation permease subunit
VRGSISAELLLLRKRRSTWILLALWTALAMFFSYVIAYIDYRNGDPGEGPGYTPSLEELLPDQLAGHLSGGFPFFGGVFALMLGVLTLGSEYGWGTLRTVFVQRPGRLQVFAAKLVALAAGLVPFVLAVFALGTVSSYAIAWNEGVASGAPPLWDLVRALAAGWLILAVWAVLGVALGLLSRGTALAIGVGILYALVIEGLISAFADQIGLLEPLVQFFLRANAYSLVEGLGATTTGAATEGPGAFSGPFVGGAQAFIVLVGYIAVFLLLSGFLLRRRDVT